eukprot:TRINITY_DN1169_c0_g1_i3.p1 TRINITY_DN1169_c0_g1~~TRINITY_DN1169_c0_g1_i3.p1  ORF type:complete len:657 (-),score=161.18 TRINITY_DN1169_c0_g1_i3:425-2395(-)
MNLAVSSQAFSLPGTGYDRQVAPAPAKAAFQAQAWFAKPPAATKAEADNSGASNVAGVGLPALALVAAPLAMERRRRKGAKRAAKAKPGQWKKETPTVAAQALGLEEHDVEPGRAARSYRQAAIRVLNSDDCTASSVCLPAASQDGKKVMFNEHQFTKMICTLGPSSSSPEVLEQMIEAGMDIARLNFSHGDHESQYRILQTVKEVEEKLAIGVGSTKCRKHMGILLDTKGPEVRTGMTRGGEKIAFTRGNIIKVTSDYDVETTGEQIALSYGKFAGAVREGQAIRIGDGALNLKVTDTSGSAEGYVMAEVLNDAEIGSRKNCNIPGLRIDLPLLQDKDKHDLVDFGLKYQVDFIAMSFVQDAESVVGVRNFLREHCPEGQKIPQLIAKIENGEGLKNFDEIVKVVDGIMIARGDLGMEIPPEQVFMAQKVMIGRCNLAGKPVITATQMLESMCKSPRPTRAEASDVANAVLDGTDCVMMSGETAAGLFPVETVQMMERICLQAERVMDPESDYLSISEALTGRRRSPDESLCHAAVRSALDCQATAILAITSSGYTVRQICKYNPNTLVVAVCSDAVVCRSLALVKGVVPLEVQQTGRDALQAAITAAQDMELIVEGDRVVVVHSSDEKRQQMQKSGSTLEDEVKFSNLMKVLTI